MLLRATAHGLTLLYPGNDDTVGPALRDYGEFSKVLSDIAADYLEFQPGTIIDVGANIGTVALPLAQRFPDSRVIAIEGHAGLAQVVGANAFANDLFNVEVVHAVAGAVSQVVDFPAISLSTAGNFGALGVHMVVDGIRKARVRMCVLDHLAPPDTRLVKIDVEGFEGEVLKGSGRLLGDTRPIWIIEAARTNEVVARQTMATMMAADYDVFWLYAPFVTRTSERDPGQPAGSLGDHNILAVPKGGPNLWDLAQIRDADEPFPVRLDAFPYLKRYGF